LLLHHQVESATGRTRCGELCAHALDLRRRLFFELCREDLDRLLLLSERWK